LSLILPVLKGKGIVDLSYAVWAYLDGGGLFGIFYLDGIVICENKERFGGFKCIYVTLRKV
jgi:hypothetical protein